MSNIVYEYNPRFCQEFSFYLKVKELMLSESAVFELPGIWGKGGGSKHLYVLLRHCKYYNSLCLSYSLL